MQLLCAPGRTLERGPAKCLQPTGLSQCQPLPLGLEWEKGFHGCLRCGLLLGDSVSSREAALGCSPRLCTARRLQLEVL